MSTIDGLYKSILLELGTRKNNNHVGSGLGGNAAQFLALTAVDVQFNTTHSSLFLLDNLTLIVNSDQLMKLSRKEIRNKLDSFLTDDLIKRLVPVPELISFMETGENREEVLSKKDLLHPKQQDLLNAFAMVSELKDLTIKELKLDSYTPIEKCSDRFKELASAIDKMPSHLILSAFRIFMGIEVIVQYNLDETLGFLLNRINQQVEIV